MRKILGALCVVMVATSAGWAKDAPSYVNMPDGWFGTEEGKHVVGNIITWQYPTGGWEKAYDASHPKGEVAPPAVVPGSPEAAAALKREAGTWDTATIDNNATHSELRILARAVTLQNDAKAKEAFFLGFDALIGAQYVNGGWPQRFPPGKNYGSHITFNDGAIVGVLEVLQKVAAGEGPYGFVDQVRREKAKGAVGKGIECILNCQIVREGKLTGWCAQHDEKTLAPAPARAYELPSLSGGEGAGLAIFLMHLEHPDERTKKAIEGAAAWFDSVKIVGKKVTYAVNAEGKRDRVVVDDAGSTIWARFYDLETNQPFFCGRDGIKKKTLAEIEIERRGGYAWYGNWGASVATEYGKWKARNGGASN